MKRLTLTNKTTYVLNESELSSVLKAINSGAKYITLQGDVLMVASIVGIQDEEKFVELDHQRNGEYKCVHGRWHGRDDKCYGHDALPVTVDETRLLKSDNRTEEEIYIAARMKSDEIREKLSRKFSHN